MDVSIIIVNYNTLSLTENTIKSVIDRTKDIKYEIILVDNASTDGSVEYFEKFGEKIIFLKNKKNLGFGRANNIGIEKAKGKYIFLLNSDTLLINNAIKILFEYMEQNKQCGICGGNLYDEFLRPNHSYGKKIPNLITEIDKNFNYIKKIYLYLKNKREDFNYENTPKKVGYITGADMFIRKNILNEVGNFDEDFFMYCEEAELTNRIVKKGYTVYSVPAAQIVHLESKSLKVKIQKVQLGQESHYKYYYKIANLKTCKYAYYIAQIGYVLSFILRFNKNYLKMYEINKEEYYKFLENYKMLKKENE